MKKHFLTALKAVLIVLTVIGVLWLGLLYMVNRAFSGPTADARLERIGKTLNLDLSQGQVMVYADSHGGFHGDGLEMTSVCFADDGLSEQLRTDGGWLPLPMSPARRRLANHEFINGERFIPEVRRGYSYFYDRHSESTDPKDDSQTYDRYSWNYTLAVYDSDRRVLYLIREDT